MNNLRKLRQSKGLTLEDVANALGITSITVSRYEREEHQLNMKIATKFADFYNVSIFEIFGSIEQQIEPENEDLKQLTEMEEQLLQKFRSLSFDDKISILSTINNIINNKNQK